MTNPSRRHRLDGLEPDNLLAFLALLGLLRALEAARPAWRPRAAWEIDTAPLRPFLQLRCPATGESIGEAVAEGVRTLAEALDFSGATRLKLSAQEARVRLTNAARRAQSGDSRQAEVWSSLITDAAIRASGEAERTPLCLLDVAQTAFLKNLSEVCRLDALPRRGDRAKQFVDAITNALFTPWRREDHTPSFRWDPVEDSRHAYRWAAPTGDKQGVEHGANLLAATGLPVLTVVPRNRNGEIRLQVVGGDVSGGFSFAWPIWREPASLSSVRTLLAHPSLRVPGAISHLGVDQIRITRRINPPGGRYANFTFATASPAVME